MDSSVSILLTVVGSLSAERIQRGVEGRGDHGRAGKGGGGGSRFSDRGE